MPDVSWSQYASEARSRLIRFVIVFVLVQQLLNDSFYRFRRTKVFRKVVSNSSLHQTTVRCVPVLLVLCVYRYYLILYAVFRTTPYTKVFLGYFSIFRFSVSIFWFPFFCTLFVLVVCTGGETPFFLFFIIVDKGCQ